MLPVHPVRGPGWYAWQSRVELGGRQAVLVPCGSVEQHGPHLPVGTDAWLAEAVAERVAAPRPGVLLAEPLAYGCSSHHKGFPGTVSLRRQTFLALIVDIATSLAGNGFLPILVNGHGGNRGALTVATQELLDQGVDAWVITYFELIEEDVANLLPGYGSAVGHACALETSMVLHLWPDAVHRERIPERSARGSWPDPFLYSKDRVIHPRLFRDLDPIGVVGDPRLATEELGERLFEAAVKRVGDVVDRIVAESGLAHA